MSILTLELTRETVTVCARRMSDSHMRRDDQQPRWRRYLRLWGPDVEADVNDELRFHMEQLVAELQARGMSASEARRAASQRFGDYRLYEEECRQIGEESERMFRRREVLGTLWQDVRYGVRQLRSNLLLTMTALITLALGIGANTAIFSVVNGVLLRKLPYPEADRLVVSGMSMPDYRDLKERSRVFEDVTVWASNLYTLRTAETPEELMGAVVAPNFFALLGSAELGHTITAADENTPVAVISHALWQRLYAGSRNVLGQVLNLSGSPYTIIGVMPASFQYPDARFDVYVPLADAMRKVPAQLENRSLRIFRVVARLRPGVTQGQVAADIRGISEQLQKEYPQTNDGLLFEFDSLFNRLVGGVRSALLVLLGAVGLVLLIACANVANLLLGLTTARSREIAVRRALGAPRGRLIRQLITESLVLSLLGGAAGLVLATWTLRFLPRLAADLPRLTEIRLDPRVLLFTIAASIATALLFGLVPALQGSRTDLNEVLKEGGRSGIGSRRGGVLRSTLVAAEVAISLVVLVGAGLLVQSLVRVVNQDIGFDPRGVVAANVGLFYFDTPEERVAKLNQVLERVAAVPGVRAIAAGTAQPPRTAQRGTGFNVIGRTPDEVEREGAFWVSVQPGYFAALRTPVRRGREFQPSDNASGAPVALISESLARALFADGDPVGQQIELSNQDAGGARRTIVGVVGNMRYSGVENAATATIYTPFAQTPFMWSYLMIRSSVDAARLARPLRAAIGGIDQRMVPARVEPATAIVSDLVATRRFITMLLSAFALLALLLAAVGIYGVIAYNVTQRRREIGVKIALGAPPMMVRRQVVGGAVSLVAVGLVAGVGASIWLTRLLTTMLYGVRATDPLTFVGGAAVLLAIGAFAALVPAWRASRVDPLTTLRDA